MALIKGIPVILYERTQTGEDAFHAPVYTETPVTVENVLITPVANAAGWPTSCASRKATLTAGRAAPWNFLARNGECTAVPPSTSRRLCLWPGTRKCRWNGLSKLRVELNSAGVRALMRSPEMQAVLKARADTVKNRCGDGYEAYVAQTRAVAVVETVSQKAYNDNSANNTLLKAVSSSRSGTVVHEHKRHLKDGRVITVRSYQRKK